MEYNLTNNKSCIILHLYYQDLWPEFEAQLVPLLENNPNIHLYVTLNEYNTPYISSIEKLSKIIFLVENRGLDVAPFLYAYKHIKDLGYKAYTKIQSKKSLHTPGIGDKWRTDLVSQLLHPNSYHYLVEHLSNTPSPVLAGNKEWYLQEDLASYNFKAALPHFEKALSLLNIPFDSSASTSINFIAGTMFMVNDNYLKSLLPPEFLDKDIMSLFEKGYASDSLAHGFERVFGYFLTRPGSKGNIILLES